MFRMKKRYIYILSFLLPFLALLCGMVIFGVAPFGDNSLLIIDGLHQYMPFFSVLYDKLRGGETLFYSFRTGLGVNFLSLFAYYLSSPMNLIIVFFPRAQLNAVVSFLLVFKLSLSGLMAGIYFTRRSKNPGFHIVALATAYALNGYMVGYSWNVMWLDSIMIFPIILLGIEKIIEDNDGRVYCLALFYALYCNYYIGFMICIFSVIWFVLGNFRSFKQIFKSGLTFAICSLLSGGMAAILLIPAYLGIKATASGSAMTLPARGWITGFWDLIARQFDMGYPISHDNFDGNANLYFGIFAIIFLFMYLLNKEIKLLDKLKNIFLIIIFYVSFNDEMFNFIWHGFHDQYGIPNRFSFLFGFVLFVMAFEVLERMDSIRIGEPVIAMLISGGILAGVYYKAENNTLAMEVLIGAAMMILVYGIILLLFRFDQAHNLFYRYMIPTLIAGEMMVTSLMGFDTNGQISISKFFYATEEMEQAIQENDDGSFYRSELAWGNMVDESTWYPMKAISLFGSTARDEMVEIMDSLGFATGCNEYLYRGATPLTNLMFGVRDLYYHKDDSLKTDFYHVKDYENMTLYQNYIKGMSLGYGIDRKIDAWYYESDYPFRVLEDFCQQGYDMKGIFTNVEVTDPVTNSCEVTNTNDGEYRFELEESLSNNLEFTIDIDHTMDNFYIFYDGTQVDSIDVSVDGYIVQSGDHDGQVLPIGYVEKGASLIVSMCLKDDVGSGYIRLSAAEFDINKFDALAEKMASEALQIEKMSDNHIEGNVTFDDEKYLFLSIPYDEGWRVWVDGKEVETTTVGNAFLAVLLPAGEHEIVLEFKPDGFLLGLIISGISLILFLLLCVFTHISRKKQKIKLQEKEKEDESTQLVISEEIQEVEVISEEFEDRPKEEEEITLVIEGVEEIVDI